MHDMVLKRLSLPQISGDCVGASVAWWRAEVSLTSSVALCSTSDVEASNLATNITY
jgi:hypothetical protein